MTGGTGKNIVHFVLSRRSAVFRAIPETRTSHKRTRLLAHPWRHPSTFQGRNSPSWHFCPWCVGYPQVSHFPWLRRRQPQTPDPQISTPDYSTRGSSLEVPGLVGRAAQGLGCYLLGSLVDRRGQHFYFYWHPATSVSRRTNPTVPTRWIRYMLNDIQRMRGGRLVCIREAQLYLVSSRLLFSDVAMGL